MCRHTHYLGSGHPVLQFGEYLYMYMYTSIYIHPYIHYTYTHYLGSGHPILQFGEYIVIPIRSACVYVWI